MKASDDTKRDEAMREVIHLIQDASDSINDMGTMLLPLCKG